MINTKTYGNSWEVLQEYVGRSVCILEKKKEGFLSIYGTPRDFIEDISGKIKYFIKENKGVLGEFAVGTAKAIIASELERRTGWSPLSAYLACSGLADIVYAAIIRPNKKLSRNNEFTIIEREALRYVGTHLESIIYKINNPSN